MHRAHYPNIVAFVEGTMEKLFINNNFSYVHLIRLNNGSSWTLCAMRDQILTNLRVLNTKPDFIVVWFDREKMSETIDTIITVVRDGIHNEGYPLETIAILIPDRMSENIILSDVECIKKEFDLPNFVYPGDSTNGKYLLRGIYSNIGENYKETYHGAKLLKKIRISRSANASYSARKFFDMLNIECWWK